MRVSRSLRFQLSVILLGLSACAGLTGERLVYDQQGIQVGIQSDPSVSRSTPPARNSHPATLSPDEMHLMLGSLQVSGWSGTLVGLIESPRPIPLFKEGELSEISSPLAMALRQTNAEERVFFSLPNREAPYSDDRTTGALFVRGAYLHVVVTDHAAFTRADTGGGDEKDLRDTKGMKLWVASPAKAAVVPASEEPRWAPFETVHVSMSVNDVLALRTVIGPARAGRVLSRPQAAPPSQEIPRTGLAAGAVPDSPEDLRLQIRELTSSNLELRTRLDEQTKQMKELKDELVRLQRELEKPKPKAQTPRKSPSP